MSGNISAANICSLDELIFSENIPADFRWKESEFTREGASAAIQYLSRIVQGDFSRYHWIQYSHSRNIIDGYNYKQLALREIKQGESERTGDVEAFCNWLGSTAKAD